MEIKGKYVIASTREEVWEALNDPDVLKECIPGCESFTRNSDTEYDASVMASIGPVKARFKTTVKLENLSPPDSYTIVGSSKGGNAGFARGNADVVLVEVPNGTELSYEANLKVGGRLAQVGSRLVTGATKKTADEFFGSLSTRLDPMALKVEEAEPERRFPFGWAIAAITAIALLLWWYLSR
jgi:carbon monoxide dehydrogenase subunit G